MCRHPSRGGMPPAGNVRGEPQRLRMAILSGLRRLGSGPIRRWSTATHLLVPRKGERQETIGLQGPGEAKTEGVAPVAVVAQAAHEPPRYTHRS